MLRRIIVISGGEGGIVSNLTAHVLDVVDFFSFRKWILIPVEESGNKLQKHNKFIWARMFLGKNWTLQVDLSDFYLFF